MTDDIPYQAVTEVADGNSPVAANCKLDGGDAARSANWEEPSETLVCEHEARTHKDQNATDATIPQDAIERCAARTGRRELNRTQLDRNTTLYRRPPLPHRKLRAIHNSPGHQALGTMDRAPTLTPDPLDYGVPPDQQEGAPTLDAAPDVDSSGANDPAPDMRAAAPDQRVDHAVIARCAAERQNDTGNGYRLQAHFGADMLHVRAVGWHRWTGTHFEREGGDGMAIQFAQRTAERIDLEADYLSTTASEQRAIDAAAHLTGKATTAMTGAEHTLRQRAEKAVEALRKRQLSRRKFAISSGNATRVKAMLAMALPKSTVAPDALDADPHAFNVLNGTLHFLREIDPDWPDPDVRRYTWRVELRPHDRADRITKCAGVIYDPQAKCPRFEAFIARFQPCEALRLFLRRYHGLGLTALMGEQVFVFHFGLGANGKSTFLETICRLMGPYAQTLPFGSVSGEGFGRRGDQATPDIARLPGARFVRVGESKRGEHLDEARIKLFTGGEPILARNLNKPFFEFRPVFKVAMSGNHQPEIAGADHGIWRRVLKVPWDVRIPAEERRHMDDVLAEFAEERSGILNWLIAGALDYLNNGLQVPAEVRAATASYREDMDPVQSFIRDCVRLVPGAEPQKSVTARGMYEAYVAWCRANALRPWKETAFGRVMPQKGFAKTDERVRRYLDVELHDVPAEMHAPVPAEEEFA